MSRGILNILCFSSVFQTVLLDNVHYYDIIAPCSTDRKGGETDGLEKARYETSQGKMGS